MPIDGLFEGLNSRLFDKRLLLRLPVVLGIILVSLLWILAAICASIADDTLRLPYPGKGLLNHYGFQVSLVAAPLVLLNTYYAVFYFLRLSRGLNDLLAPGADISVVRTIIRPHIRSLLLRAKWRNILWLSMIAGLATSVAIFRNLNDPVDYWGNDVFNATYYRYGYYAANSFFIWLWAFVYPVGIFYAVHLTLSTQMIVGRLKQRRLLRLDFLNIDRCAGMSRFGTLNFVVMLIYVWPLCAVFAFYFTHRYTYLSLLVAAFSVSLLFIVQSVYGIYWVSQTIVSERRLAVASLNEKITDAMNGNRRNSAVAGTTLQYRDKVLSVHALPYSHGVGVAVNVLRFAPAMLAILKHFTG